MRHFFRFFSKNKYVGWIITLSILIAGIFSFFQLQRDTFPQVDLDEIRIETRYKGHASVDIQEFITKPIEEAIDSISGIKEYSSQSSEGYSYIRILIDEFSDTRKVKDHIFRQINALSNLPKELENRPVITQVDNSAFAVVELALSGFKNKEERYNLSKRLLDDLKSLKQVSLVETLGYQEKEVQVLLDLDKLKTLQLSISHIQSHLESQNKRASLGQIKSKDRIQTLTADYQFKHLDDIRNSIIQSNFDQQSLRIRDVARVEERFEEAQDYAHINGKDAVSFRIYKSNQADILETMKAIQASVLTQAFPEHIKHTYTQDSSFYLKNRLNVLFSNGLMGLVLILMILPVFLPLKLSKWVAIGIPTCLAGCFAGLLLFDRSINVLSLLAIILIIGIIIDDAIIVVENIARHLEKGKTAIDAATDGIKEVFLPVLSTLLTTFIAFSPMFFMKGIMGKFVFVIPLVVGIALVISLIELSLALPSHVSHSLAKTPKHTQKSGWRSSFLETLKARYERALNPCLNRPKTCVLISLIVFIAALLFAKHIQQFELFSNKSAHEIVIECEFPTETSLESNKKHMKTLETLLLEEGAKDITGFSTRVGYEGPYSYRKMAKARYSQVIVDLSPPGQRKRSASDLINDLREKTNTLDSFKSIQFHIDAGGPPIGKAITLTIISDDELNRDKNLLLLKQRLSTLQGVSNIKDNNTFEGNQITINIKRDKIARLGIQIPRLLNSIQSVYQGKKAGYIQLKGQNQDIVVTVDETLKNKPKTLSKLLIPNQQGRLIPISELLEIRSIPIEPTIHHFNGKQSLTLTADLDKTKNSLSTIIAQLKADFQEAKLSNTTLMIGGEGDESKKSVQELLKSFFLASVGIYFILVLLFQSLLQPLLVMLAIPAGILGVIIAFALHQMPFSFIGIIGTIGLCGVVVNDSLILVNHINSYRNQGILAPKDYILEAAKDRLRPIILTSVTTIAGLLPLAYGFGGQDAFIQPMALAMAYGLLFATPLILFVLPCLYLITSPKHRLKSQSVSFETISIDEKNKDSEHLAPTKERRIAP